MPAASPGVARFVLLFLGVVLIMAGLFGAVTGAFTVVACTGTDVYQSVQYQGTVTDAQTGATIASASYILSDTSNLNATLTGGQTGSTGFYQKLVTSTTTLTTQRGCDSIGFLFSKSGYVLGWTTVQLPGNDCGGSPNPCNSFTEILNFALAEQSPLVAHFTYATSSLIVQFTDGSSGQPTSWSWNFGDGSTSTLQNPQHSYGVGGTYTVQLTVSRPSPLSTSSTGATITVTQAVSGTGTSAPPAPPAQQPGPQPVTNATSPTGPTGPGGSPTAKPTLLQQIEQVFAPSLVAVALVVIGSVLVVIAAGMKG